MATGGYAARTYAVSDSVSSNVAQTLIEHSVVLDILTVVGLYLAPMLVIWRFIKMLLEIKSDYMNWKTKSNTDKGTLDI